MDKELNQEEKEAFTALYLAGAKFGINEIRESIKVIPQNVTFHGRLPHEKTISMLCRSDFSVFFRQPSRVNNAGFPTKFAEAQTAGIPVISSKFSDLEDYVVEGKNGFLANGIEIEDINAVLDRVASLGRKDIEDMHSYTREHRVFDLQMYNNSLRLFFESILRQ